MKQLLTIFLFLPFISNATIHYMKDTGGAGSGADDANAWSLAKHNATFIPAGDTVLLKLGSVFNGELILNNSGTSAAHIYYGTYGTGAAPIINGLTILTGWTLLSGNLYWVPLTVPTLHVVTVNDTLKWQGRYPETGYLTYTGHTTNTAISATNVSAIPSNPAGADLVIRKTRYILDRHNITSRSSNTLNYGIIPSSDYDGTSSAYSPQDGCGYFIQNALWACTKFGDWYYDSTADRLYMNFGGTLPTAYTVKASTQTQNVYINTYSYIDFNGINFQGGNNYGIYNVGNSNINFINCNIKWAGSTGLYMINTAKIQMTGGSVTYCLNNGIWGETGCDTTSIIGVTVDHNGYIAGAGRSGDGAQEGIAISGNWNTVKNCTVKNSGYNGIGMFGGHILCDGNTVDTACFVKDDGGGIYHQGLGAGDTSNIFSNNTVSHALGALPGSGAGVSSVSYGMACGIYLDQGSRRVKLSGNTVAHGPWAGVLINYNLPGDTILNTTASDFQLNIAIYGGTGYAPRNMVVQGINSIAGLGQYAMFVLVANPDDISQMGAFTSNRYFNPTSNNNFFVQRSYVPTDEHLTLKQWQTTYGLDLNSKSNGTLLLSGGHVLKVGGNVLTINQ